MKRENRIKVGKRLLSLVTAIVVTGLWLTACGDQSDKFNISGQVVSGGSALSGVTLMLSGSRSASATSDANGNYTFGDLDNGSYTITPGKAGFSFIPISIPQTINGASINAVNFTATPAATFSLSGTVTFGGIGLSGVTMMLSGSSAYVTTDTNGNYTFGGLVNGSYTITPSKTGFTFNPASSVQTINGANITSINFAPSPTINLSIYGSVTSGGLGLPGATMTLSVRGLNTAVATTDANGTYLFGGLVNDTYTITPSKTGFTFTPTNSSQVVSGTNITAFNFTAASTQGAQVVSCPSSGTTNVAIQDFSFTPFAVTVGTNGIVKWTNGGPSTHTITSGTTLNIDGKFNSGNLVTGSSVCVQFTTAGLYPYFSALDSSMTGSVTVQ